MKKKTKSVLCMLLSLLLAAAVLAAVPVTAGAEETEPAPYHAAGDCGATKPANVKWFVFHDGSIAFFGSEDIMSCPPNPDGTPSAPWYTENIVAGLTATKISVEDGVTGIGDYALYVPAYYTVMLQSYNIELPNSLITIGAHAFENQNKLEKITLPQNVASIGADAFRGCTKLAHIDLFGDPSRLNWADDSNPFTQQVTCHIQPAYESQLETLQARYQDKHIKFEANLYYDNSMLENNVKRNIKGYIAQENINILGGAAPFVVVGTFSGAKKSVTHGSNGFASCVKIGNTYYVHTNNNSRSLNQATMNSLTGVVTSLSQTDHPTLKLQTTYEYVGSNIVKLIYTLKNEGGTPIDNVMLGGTGDIKIGADDYAAIEPLTEDGTQVGFYMKSGKEYDRSGDAYATLGFIGKNVDIDDNTKSPDATFFYGTAAANKGQSATGAFKHRLMPERVFTPNADARETGSYERGKDSGMSYYWNVGTVAAGGTKQYAVLFSVYGEESSTEGTGMLDELKETYYTVTWANEDGTVLEKQIVKQGEVPAYTEALPQKAHDGKHDYEFDGWTPAVAACEGDTTYTAQFIPVGRRLFAGHSLTLRGDIGVNFYLDVPVADVAVEDVLSGAVKPEVKFTWFNKHSEHEVVAADYDPDTGYFIARCNVAAPEMAYTIHAEAYFNGVKYTAEYDDYSVRDYGKYITDHPDSFSLPLVDLAKKMLDYGAKSQIVFDRLKNTDGTAIPMANDGVDYAMQPHTIESDYPDMTAVPENSGLQYYNTSLLFLTKTGLRQYYQVTDQAKFDALSNRAAFKQNGTLYYLEVEEIPAFELNDKQTFTVGGQTYAYSALDYAMKLQEKPQASMQNLGTALYWYYDAANTYFSGLTA